MDLQFEPQPDAPSRPRRSPFKIVVKLIVGAILAFGLLFVAVILWFFAICANNPDCLRFG